MTFLSMFCGGRYAMRSTALEGDPECLRQRVFREWSPLLGKSSPMLLPRKINSLKKAIDPNGTVSVRSPEIERAQCPLSAHFRLFQHDLR